MPIWVLCVIVFAGAFCGAFFAAAFSISKKEDERNGKERLS